MDVLHLGRSKASKIFVAYISRKSDKRNQDHVHDLLVKDSSINYLILDDLIRNGSTLFNILFVLEKSRNLCINTTGSRQVDLVRHETYYCYFLDMYG